MIPLHLLGILGLTVVLYQCAVDGSLVAALWGASLMAIALLGLNLEDDRR